MALVLLFLTVSPTCPSRVGPALFSLHTQGVQPHRSRGRGRSSPRSGGATHKSTAARGVIASNTIQKTNRRRSTRFGFEFISGEYLVRIAEGRHGRFDAVPRADSPCNGSGGSGDGGATFFRNAKGLNPERGERCRQRRNARWGKKRRGQEEEDETTRAK